MRFGLLGPLEVRDGAGRPVDVGGAQPRAVLAALLVGAGRVVSTDALIDAVWGGRPPASAPGTLQTYVSRLRRALEPAEILREPPGYRLDLASATIDFLEFERLADDGARALSAGRTEEARRLLAEAEGLWRGPALTELPDSTPARGLATRLEERRLVVLEQRLEAGLALGRPGEVAAEAAAAVASSPLRERLWELLALALYRSGRQAEALRALDRARTTLVEQLGVEPSPPLRELEAGILAHDPALSGPAAAAAPAPAAAAGPPPAPVELGGGRVVGRDPELAALGGSLAEAARGPRFVVVEGEPGIGKTRLLEAVAEQAGGEGRLVLWGRTHESGAAPALWPWLGALRTLAEARPEVATGIEHLLAPGGGEGPTEAGAARFRLFESVSAALATATRTSPLVLLLDDLQWADATSLELLAYLATRLTTEPVLVGAAVRQLEIGRSDELTDALVAIARRPGSRRIGLRALGGAATDQLLDAAAGRPVAPAVAAAIHRRAGGNPFFVSELTRLLGDEGVLDDPEAVARIPVPAGVRDVLRRRLDRLPPATVELLRTAAVLGRDVALPVLVAASNTDVGDCLDLLEPAAAQHLLTEVPEAPGANRFAHALVREVLVEDLSTARRARLHLQAADALQQVSGDDDDVAELLAEHLWVAAPLGVEDRAAAALERAAEVALRRNAFRPAEQALRRALALRGGGGDPARLGAQLATLLKLAAVVRTLDGYAETIELIEKGESLASRLGQEELYLQLLYAEWTASNSACDYARADPIAERFRDEGARAADPSLRMLGRAVWGVRCWHRGELTESAEHLDAARQLALELPAERDLTTIRSEQRLLVEVFATHVHDLVGDLPDPAAAFDEVMAAQQDPLAVAMAAAFAAASATAVGDLERAGRVARRGLAADPDVAFSFWGGGTTMADGISLVVAGRVDEGVARFQAGLASYLSTGFRTSVGLFEASMAIALVGAGRLDDARPHLARAQEELAVRGERWPAAVVALAEAEVRAAEGGPPAEVAALLAGAERLATEQGAGAVARRVAAAAERLGAAARA